MKIHHSALIPKNQSVRSNRQKNLLREGKLLYLILILEEQKKLQYRFTKKMKPRDRGKTRIKFDEFDGNKESMI